MSRPVVDNLIEPSPKSSCTAAARTRSSLAAARMATRLQVRDRSITIASAPMPIPEEIAIEDTLEIPSWLGAIDPSEVYALRVKGDSMIDAMIRDGDIVLFRKQNTAQNGDMVAVWLDEQNATTLKHFYNEGYRIRLQPAHPMMDPIYVDPAHCHVQGKVLSVIRQMN